MLSVTNPLGHTSSVTYSALGLVSSATDPSGNVTSYEYDKAGNLTKITAPDGGVTSFTYNARGMLTSVTDAESHRTSYEFDQYGRLAKETRPRGEYAVFAYDTLGRMSTKTDAKGQVSAYTYDSLGRVTSISYTGGKVESFTYDSYGRLAAYSGAVSGSFTYDKFGRVLTETVDYGAFSKTYSYTYDAHGNKSSFTMPEGGSYTYAHNALGQTESLSFGGKTINFAYDFDRMSSMTLPNGVVTDYSYDGAGRLSGIKASSAAGTVMEHGYTRGPGGRIDVRATGHGTYSYTYDAAERLTGATRPGLSDESFAYDRVGNRTASVGASDWSYTANNELVGHGDVSYTYDANGNTTSKTEAGLVTSYVYNAQDQLAQVNLPDGRVATYAYDPFGRRISKTVDGVTTYFLYSQEGLVGEYDSTGGLKKSYGWMPDGTWGTDPVFAVENGDVYYYHNDHLGTPWKLTDGNGDVVWSATYDVFGKAAVSSDSTIENNLRFPGQYYDEETGLHYNWFRHYDPSTGRYITADPIGLNAGANLYMYAYGSPISNKDPIGLFCPQIFYRGILKLIAGIASAAVAVLTFPATFTGVGVVVPAFALYSAIMFSVDGIIDMAYGAVSQDCVELPPTSLVYWTTYIATGFDKDSAKLANDTVNFVFSFLGVTSARYLGEAVEVFRAFKVGKNLSAFLNSLLNVANKKDVDVPNGGNPNGSNPNGGNPNGGNQKGGGRDVI